ncbi:DUF305 domain-containing protein [Dyadobacter frigoris]|uniref:DUF305 domain-containing protein n=1 Tax=Dyadobacter frigoris TaxID=2576211 RepID=UPI00286DC9B4|nr:hypothetical protein [Dyadobacter frigoris]
MTSQVANLNYPEVKKLAEGIIKSQREEIAQMKAILEREENSFFIAQRFLCCSIS